MYVVSVHVLYRVMAAHKAIDIRATTHTFDRIVKLRNHVNHILAGDELKHTVTCYDAKSVVFGEVPVQNLGIRTNADFFRNVVALTWFCMQIVKVWW